MVTMDKIRTDMAVHLNSDKAIQYIDVHADTLEEALADAAVQLDSRVNLLEYEVLEQGFAGIIGIMKKPWLVRVYENKKAVKKRQKDIIAKNEENSAVDAGDLEQHVDGVFYVHYFDAQVNLKVSLPKGKGLPVQLAAVMAHLNRADILSLEENAIKQFVKNGTNDQYEPIGQYSHNRAGDASFYVDVQPEGLTASIVATAPSLSGAEIQTSRIIKMLQTQGVVTGISEEKIAAFVDNPVYGIPYVVAEAIPAIDGKDAHIVYNFETDRSKLKIKETKTGQMDFKELNLIQNVVEGQPLAQKIPAERGRGGKTVFGRYIEAKNGKDIPFPLGKNVKIDIDGKTILASCNGQVLLINDKINVESVKEIDGVNIKTGNITFLGTLIVKGNIEDGFHVKVSGNIEVYGTIGNSVVEADGDIIVSLGVMGKDEGHIKTGKSLWAKFIQNSNVTASEYVIVQDGIINSNVTADKKVIVQGRRAAIIGGHIFATEEIHAKNIGSSAGGTETILEVGYDPKAKRRLTDLTDKQVVLMKELDEVELNVQTLANLKKVRKKLPHDKEENLVALVARQKEIQAEVETMTTEIQKIQTYLRELRVVGKISASGKVYSGVKLFIRDGKEEVRNETKAVSFYLENGFIRYGKYVPPSDEDTRRIPDGYSTH